MVSNLQIYDDPAVLCEIFRTADTSAFPDLDSHPLYGQFARELGAAINLNRQQHVLAHFAIIESNEPVLLVPATCDGNNVSMFQSPIQFAVRHDISNKRKKQVYGAAFQMLGDIARAHKASEIHILGGDNRRNLEGIDLVCINHGARPHLRIHAVIDLDHDEKNIRRHLRKSYRSLVNWGRDNIRTLYINIENPDRQLFDQYSNFHAKVGGKVHYGHAYWDVYWNEITAGRGELSLGYLNDGHLAVGTLVIYAGEIAYYASGVYDRNRLDKPLGHFPVFDSIIRANKRGLAMYDLGEIFPSGTVPEKEVQIGFFKKGFASSYILRKTWKLSIN